MLKRALGEHTREGELTDEDSLSHHSDSVMDYGRRTAGRGDSPYATIGMETNIKESCYTELQLVTKFCITSSFLIFFFYFYC